MSLPTLPFITHRRSLTSGLSARKSGGCFTWWTEVCVLCDSLLTCYFHTELLHYFRLQKAAENMKISRISEQAHSWECQN